MSVLNRGFVWRSRYGHKDFLAWDEFVSIELLNQSYRQWCGDNRVFYPEHREALGTFMNKSYPKAHREASTRSMRLRVSIATHRTR